MENHNMSVHQLWLKQITNIAIILMMGVSLSACAGLFNRTLSWKEEVRLHDGQKIIVKRSQSYGGRHEIGQPSPIKEHTISFTLPNSSKAITWTSEYGEDLGRTNFNLLAIHVLNGTPYIVTSPNLCLSYNKWGRPNPPYVFFKYDGKAWQRIGLEEFPAEFKTINVALDIQGREVEELDKMGFASVDKIKQLNAHTTIPEYKGILRDLIRSAGEGCGEMVYDGNGGWDGIGWFSEQPSKEACLKYCEQKKMAAQYCPCNTLFNGK
jgi:hypothetical protein